jgi:rSAM/selenodomain-associated transferase 1
MPASVEPAGGAAAIVIAKAPRPGLCKTRLEPLLGPEGCARLQRALIRRAAAWAAAVGTPYVTFTPGDARAELEALVPPGTTLIEQEEGDLGDRLAAAIGQVLAEHGGPVVLVGVDTPLLDPHVGREALEDLADGCDVSFGPAHDGGFYLVALRRPHPELFALPTEAWGGPDVLRLSLQAAHAAGLSVGLLRGERDLDEPADAYALLADPLTPPDVVEALRPAQGA